MDKEQNGKPVRRKRRVREQVTYTEPKPFNKKKFFLTLGIILSIVLALFFVITLFFTVGSTTECVLVEGCDRYTSADVIEASGIHEGDSLIGLNKAKVRARILQKLPYVESVRVGITLPDTVKIEITESSVIYSVESLDGNWWLMSASGKILEQTNWLDAKDYTVCSGVRIQVPIPGQDAVAIEPEPVVDAEGNTVPPVLSGQQSLSTVLQILQLLEEHGVLGSAASVSIEDPANIQIWYGEQFRIDLGDHLDMTKKVPMAVSALRELEGDRTGVIDVSFTLKADQVVFTPFAN